MDEDITNVAGFWGAAASDAGRNFPHDRVVQALSESLDQREKFARAIALAAGWNVGV